MLLDSAVRNLVSCQWVRLDSIPLDRHQCTVASQSVFTDRVSSQKPTSETKVDWKQHASRRAEALRSVGGTRKFSRSVRRVPLLCQALPPGLRPTE